jgi:hypothetical protein
VTLVTYPGPPTPGREDGDGYVPRAEKTRVGEMENLRIAWYVGLSVKITTEEVESLYSPRGQQSEVGKVQMSARVCAVREATVSRGTSCV